MSRRRQRAHPSPCVKVRYGTEIAAKLALANIQHEDASWRPKIEARAYPCPKCRGWHLTSKGKFGE